MSHPVTAAPASMAGFLSAENRQVWALHRESGEPFYLREGEAEQYRAFAREHLRCPHPGCEVRLSTRGGTKRAHFFHADPVSHETGPESMFHLASKAMLAQWASVRVPQGAVVCEEQSVKDSRNARARLVRRADVMATGRTGRRMAYEVEYKAFAVEDWARKQADYDNEEVMCLWLLGHTRLRARATTATAAGQTWHGVSVPLLAAHIARAGHPVAAINPVTRQIGTFSADPEGTRPYLGLGTEAWLWVEDLADCDFDPRLGVLSPTARRIREATRGLREAFERAQADAERQRLAQNAEMARLDDLRRKQEARWHATALRARFLQRWGYIPDPLSIDYGHPWGVWAHTAHWHGVLYEALLHERTEDFGWREVYAALDEAKIRLHPKNKYAFQAIVIWLEALSKAGLVRIHRDERGRVTRVAGTGRTADHAQTEAQKAAERARAEQAERLADWEARAPERQTQREQVRAAQQAAEDRRRTRLVITPDGKRRWVPK